MDTNLQFRQSLESEQEKAARVLAPAMQFGSAVYGSDADKELSRNTPVDNYLIGRNLIVNSGEKPTLFQTTAGRISARLVSRGVFGAIAFTWAQNYAGRSMRNYSPESIRTLNEWRQALFNPRSVAKQTAAFENVPNTMQAIAKAYDVVAGTPIRMIARAFDPLGAKGDWAEKAVLFRQRTMHKDPVSTKRPIASYGPNENPYAVRSYGRSLGAEVVSVTADFAAASFADSLARNIIDTADPNNTRARKAWKDENGNFSAGNFAWDWTKRLWRVVSFNQGEDWAVALPYVYFIKWHRNVIDKYSPGFKLASDNPSWQAASDKLTAVLEKDAKLTAAIDKDTKIEKLQWMGDFQKEGAWDLQARFTMYNVFTLMFREGYTKLGSALGSWWKGDSWTPQMHLPDGNPIVNAVEGVGNTARYAAKSFIKANLYMQPAVPFFWGFRTSQSKWQSSPIVTHVQDHLGNKKRLENPWLITKMPATANDIHGKMLHKYIDDSAQSNHLQYRAREYLDEVQTVTKSQPHKGMRFSEEGVRYHTLRDIDRAGSVFVKDVEVHSHPYASGYTLYDHTRTTSLFGALTKPLGKASFTTGSWVSNSVKKASDGTKWFTDKALGLKDVKNYDGTTDAEATKWNRERAVRTAVDASFSYTPYMITKAETALRWDNPDMDKAAYRLIDGVMSLDVSEVKRAISEIGDLLVHPRTRDENAPDANVNPVDASLKPATKIVAGNVQRDSLVHAPHRTIQ